MKRKISESDLIVEDRKILKECPLLKATPEIRTAIENLGSEENFKVFSPIILKYINELLVTNDDLENEDIKYVIRRLVVGLASKRQLFRHGFFVTLKVLLSLHPEVLPMTYNISKKFYSQEQSKNAVADHIIGHILALGAIIRSGCALQNKQFASLIIEKLNILRTSCSYTDPIVGQFLIHFLKNEGDEGTDLIWDITKTNLLEPLRVLPPCLLWLRIVLSRKEYMKKLANKNVPSDFAKETLGSLSYSIVYSLMKKMFAEKVNIAPMFKDYLLSLSLYDGESNMDENLVGFFNKCVLPVLEDQSPLKNGFNFSIIEFMMPYLVDVEHIKCVLCPAFVQRLVSASSLKGELAVLGARKVIDAILQKIILHKDKDDEVQITILQQLIHSPGTVRFDKVTGSNLFQLSYEHLNVSTVQKLCDELFTVIENDKYEVSTGLNGLGLFSGDFLMATQWIGKLISHPKVTGSIHSEWRATHLALLLKNIFFRKHPEKEFNSLKEIFLKALEHPTKKLEDQITVVDLIVNITNSNMKKLKKSNHLSGGIEECWSDVYKTIKKLQKQDCNHSQRDLTIFRLFYGQMILHLFLNSKMAKEVIAELDECYSEAVKSKCGGNKKSSGPDWVEVVIDLLLSLLSKGDHYWRKFVVSVFRNICHLMEPASMTLISDIINPDKEQNFLSSSEDENESDGDDDTDEEDSSDDENNEDVDESGSDDDDEEEEDESDNDEENDNEEEMNAKEEKELKMLKLREEMQKLVGLPDEDIDMDSVPAEELDALDKNVGAMMKLFLSLRKSTTKKKKTKLAKDETSLMHFRTRVCDLLEGIVVEAPSFSHLLNLLHPLLLAISKASKDDLQRQLYTRLKSIFNDLVKVKKFASKSLTQEDVANEIAPLFELSRKLPIHMSKEIGLACTFLVRNGLNLDEKKDSEKYNVIISAYTDQLELFFSKKDWDISEVAFSGPLLLDTGLLAPAVKLLIQFAFHDSMRFFRKQQALDLLKLCFLNDKSLKKLTPKSLKSLQKKLSSHVVQQFDSITEAKYIKVLQLVAVFELLKGLNVFHKHNPELAKSFQWGEVKISIESFYKRVSIDHMKPLKKALNSLAQALQIKLERIEPAPAVGILKKSEQKENKDGDSQKEGEDMLVAFNGEEEIEAEKTVKQLKKEKKKLKMEKMSKIENKPLIDDAEKVKKMKAKKLLKKQKKIQKLKERNENKLDTPLFEDFNILDLQNL